MPVTLRDRISEDIRHALDDTAIAARLAGMGLTVAPGDAEEFARSVEEHRRHVHEIVRIIGLKLVSASGGR
jgi:tripartite-type tricarboxylate transporter receptor subunit TctC